MCTPTPGTMIPYGLKIPSPYFSFGPSGGGVTQGQLAALDFQRSQLHDYNVRVQLGLRNYQHSLGLSPFHTYITDPYAHAYFYKHDPRARFVQEEPKPSHSYIGLIGMAILQSKDKKLVLSDIYQWILDNYPYFRTRGPGWRNSIRHNLSLNDCFIKSGRSANGKGHYWAVHPANVEDFERGDFRRRRAQRKVRRHMGLAVPDDDDSPSPSPTQPWMHHDVLGSTVGNKSTPDVKQPGDLDTSSIGDLSHNPEAMRLLLPQHPTPAFGLAGLGMKKPSRKRLFDMASLLAPDDDESDEIVPEKIRSMALQQTSPKDNIHSDDEGLQRGNKINDDGSAIMVCRNRSDDQNLCDDDNFCDDDIDDDEDNEEIHVTSDEESSERLDSSKCFSDVNSNLSVHGNHKRAEESGSFIYRHGVNKTNNECPSEQSIDDADEENVSRCQEEQQQLDGRETNKHSQEHSNPDYNSINNDPHTQQNTVQNAIVTKSFYDFMANKLRDQDNHFFHPLDRPSVRAHLNIPHRDQPESYKNYLNHSRVSDIAVSTSEDAHTTASNSISFREDSPKSEDHRHISDMDHQRNRHSIESPVSPSESINSLRQEHRQLQTIPKDFSKEKFSAFESLGIRPHPSLFSGHLHPGMLRAMAPFNGPAMLAQGHVLRPGIPTSCLQHLQASPAVSVPLLPPMGAQTQQESGENKR